MSVFSPIWKNSEQKMLGKSNNKNWDFQIFEYDDDGDNNNVLFRTF